jgi:hypothetical protein
MVDDIEYHLITKYKQIIYQPTDSELQAKLLEELQHIFAKNGVNISRYNLPQISTEYTVCKCTNSRHTESHYARLILKHGTIYTTRQTPILLYSM